MQVFLKMQLAVQIFEFLLEAFPYFGLRMFGHVLWYQNILNHNIRGHMVKCNIIVPTHFPKYI